MRKKTAAAVLATGLVAGGAALLVPGAASAADASSTPSSTASPSTSATDRVAERATAIKDALKGLVSDGTINQAQADEVASTLAESRPGWDGRDGWDGPGWGGPGGRGWHGDWVSPDQVASILGITTDELRTARQDGQTLAQIAQAHGVSRSDLVEKLVAAAEAELAEDVKAGRITQAQSDEISSGLSARISDMVDRTRPDRGDHGGWGRDGDDDAPSSTASPSSSATS